MARIGRDLLQTDTRTDPKDKDKYLANNIVSGILNPQ